MGGHGWLTLAYMSKLANEMFVSVQVQMHCSFFSFKNSLIFVVIKAGFGILAYISKLAN